MLFKQTETKMSNKSVLCTDNVVLNQVGNLRNFSGVIWPCVYMWKTLESTIGKAFWEGVAFL